MAIRQEKPIETIASRLDCAHSVSPRSSSPEHNPTNRSSLRGGPRKQPFFNKTANDMSSSDMDLLNNIRLSDKLLDNTWVKLTGLSSELQTCR
jgi:hypothetical protein